MSLVSVPYKITLLSNNLDGLTTVFTVSVPYKITLLSNDKLRKIIIHKVSVPYKITLLSNRADKAPYYLSFQYLIKLHYSQT